MELPRFEDIVRAARGAAAPCVSVYMPTHTAGRETRQDPTRLKTLLRGAAQAAGAAGIDGRNTADVLHAAEALLVDEDFWQHQRRGLALLLAPGVQHVLRVPFELPEFAVVGDRLHIAPLLPLDENFGFRVLRLSRNRVQLLRCDRWSVEEEQVDSMPADMKAALARDAAEPTLQWHSFGLPHAMRSVFHGYGTTGKESREEADLLRFLRMVDAALSEHDQAKGTSMPLVLACVAECGVRFRQVTRQADLVDDVIHGNPDETPAEELHRRAFELVGARLRTRHERAIEFHKGLAGTGLTSNAPEMVVAAAHEGRVRDLFVVPGVHLWGRPGRDGVGSVQVHASQEPGDVDLLDGAVVDTIARGGAVHVADAAVTGASGLSATLRY